MNEGKGLEGLINIRCCKEMIEKVESNKGVVSFALIILIHFTRTKNMACLFTFVCSLEQC